MTTDSEERNYLQEAFAILNGLSALITEKRHLEALYEYHECQQIVTANDLEAIKRKVLNTK